MICTPKLKFTGLALALLMVMGWATGCSHAQKPAPAIAQAPVIKEPHLKSLKQLTFEGTHAEAYFSPDSQKLIFQGRDGAHPCDQMYTMNVDGSEKKLISKGGGRNTCGYFINNERVLFSSTLSDGAECPKERDRSKGYVWEIFKSYEIYSAQDDGSDLKSLTRKPGYDAESTVCNGKIVFTSSRKNDSLNIFTMNLDGSGVKQLTHEVGYSGGPFFSPDCSQIVYRAFHPKGDAEITEFKKAVREGYIPHSNLELFVMKANGTKKTQLTTLNAASFAPSFYPHGDKVMFSSNLQGGRVFQLYAVDAKTPNQTTGEQITTEGSFNGFPMFSPDGKHLIFASNRNSSNPHELQIFLAEWAD